MSGHLYGHVDPDARPIIECLQRRRIRFGAAPLMGVDHKCIAAMMPDIQAVEALAIILASEIEDEAARELAKRVALWRGNDGSFIVVFLDIPIFDIETEH